VAQLAKCSFELRQQRAFGAALERFGDKGAPGFKNLRGDGECRLGERDNSQVVGRGVAGRRRRHVTQYDIGRAAEFGLDGRRDSCVLNIGPQDRGSGYRRGLSEIDPDDRAARADALDGDLGPAARRATEVDHPAARQQQPKTVVQFDQFEGRARPVTEPLRLCDIGSFS
jgi:hypothetical protein